MKLIYAIATLSGTIIGVGLFSLPYITSIAKHYFIVRRKTEKSIGVS